jgi:hypothetical protein
VINSGWKKRQWPQYADSSEGETTRLCFLETKSAGMYTRHSFVLGDEEMARLTYQLNLQAA